MLHALQQQVGQPVGGVPDLVRAWPPNGVLLLDTYETLAPLNSWLRETLLPQPPAHTLVVIARRIPPAPCQWVRTPSPAA